MGNKLWRTIKKCFAKVRKFFKKGNAKVSVAINPKEVDELKTALLEVTLKVVTRSVPFSTAQLNVTRSVPFSTAQLNVTRSLPLSTAQLNVTRSLPFSTAQLNVTRSKAFSTAQLNVTRSKAFSTAQLNVTRSLPLSTATLNATRSLPLSTATETSAPSALEFMTQTPELATLNVPSCIEASQLATMELDCCSEQCAITSTTKVPEQTCSSDLPSEKQHTRPCSPPAMQSRMRKIRNNRRMTLAIPPDLSVILGNQ